MPRGSKQLRSSRCFFCCSSLSSHLCLPRLLHSAGLGRGLRLGVEREGARVDGASAALAGRPEGRGLERLCDDKGGERWTMRMRMKRTSEAQNTTCPSQPVERANERCSPWSSARAPPRWPASRAPRPSGSIGACPHRRSKTCPAPAGKQRECVSFRVRRAWEQQRQRAAATAQARS